MWEAILFMAKMRVETEESMATVKFFWGERIKGISKRVAVSGCSPGESKKSGETCNVFGYNTEQCPANSITSD
jgi:hypothetical protein